MSKEVIEPGTQKAIMFTADVDCHEWYSYGDHGTVDTLTTEGWKMREAFLVEQVDPCDCGEDGPYHAWISVASRDGRICLPFDWSTEDDVYADVSPGDLVILEPTEDFYFDYLEFSSEGSEDDRIWRIVK